MRSACLAFSLGCLIFGCSSAEDEPSAPSDAVSATPAPLQPVTPAPPGAEPEASDAPSDAASEDSVAEALNPALVVFRDPDSDFGTADVYDATREIVRFDAERAAMVSATTGDSVSGWMTDGNDLGPVGAFRVRFGSEGGQRRAYFTETGNGTICNIVLSGPERVDIYGTSERPPME
jgi:hypothetical protein